MKLLTTLLLAVVCATGFSQDTLLKPTVYGGADIYYLMDVTTDQENPFQYNYSADNQFAVNNAQIGAKAEGLKVRYDFGLQYGTYVVANNALVSAATVGVKVFGWWVDAGVIPSHIGSESASPSVDQWTLSRSYTAENTPYFQTGVRAVRDFGSFDVGLYVLNGWQNVADSNDNKAVGTHIQFEKGNFKIGWNTFYGEAANMPENIISTTMDERHYLRAMSDLYLQYDFRKWHAAYQLDYAEERKARPSEGTQNRRYVNNLLTVMFDATDKLSLSARGESLNNPDGVMSGRGATANNILAASAGFRYAVSRTCAFRGEFRYTDHQYNGISGVPFRQAAVSLTKVF